MLVCPVDLFPTWSVFVLCNTFLSAPPAGYKAAGKRQPACLHELPVKAVRNAPEEVRKQAVSVLHAEIVHPGNTLMVFLFPLPHHFSFIL